MNGGTLTMNNSKITFDGLGGYGETLYLPFPLMTNAQKTINLSNTVFEGANYYALIEGSNAVINTTDAPEAWAGKTSGVTVNFIQP